MDSAEYWLDQVSKASDSFSTWHERGKKVVDRYRDDRGGTSRLERKFNILWSNVQVMKPALYGRMPKPEVSRRYRDQDQVGRVASTILERCLEYEVEQYADFNAAMSGAVEDRLLPGRGVAWVRYEPKINTVDAEPQVSEDVDAQIESLAYECAPCDYVNWQDFLHNPSRTWDEVWWVARRVWFTKSEGVERFGDIFNTVPTENKKETSADKETPKDALTKKAQVWEIWDKSKKTVVWIAKGFPMILDEREDPLQLEGFFPCPRPLYATTTTGSLIPIPDYCQYQDQAEELDTITKRIHLLTRALKVRGVYNAEFKELKRLLSETEDNELIPVSSWAAFAEKGGMKGAVDWMPIADVAAVLEKLNLQRQECLQVIYQTIGLSDIMRGASDKEETATAQKLKANFGSMRLRSSQSEVATFATDLLRKKAEIICGFFSPETMIEMSGIANTLDGQNPQIVQEAIALLKQRNLRSFRISVESDTLAQIDETAEKEETSMFITSMGSILKEAAPIIQGAPTMMPFIGEIMKLAARKQRAGRSVELALEQSLQATQQAMSQPKPDPAAQAEQAKAAAIEKKATLDVQVAEHKAGLEERKMAREEQHDMTKFALEAQHEQEQAARDQELAEQAHVNAVRSAQLKVDTAKAMPKKGA